ncbi:MAG: hypothetical protein J6Y13_10020 [Treponema sp.]|nr:hypothetical protein [Treponema sp.]
MATSSITHNFTISTPKGVEQFISAVEEAEKEFPCLWKDSTRLAERFGKACRKIRQGLQKDSARLMERFDKAYGKIRQGLWKDSARLAERFDKACRKIRQGLWKDSARLAASST